MATKKRIPLYPSIPGVPDFPGIRSIVYVFTALFSGGILQGAGRLETTSILGVI